MVVKGKLLIAPIIGFIGSILLLIASFTAFDMNSFLIYYGANRTMVTFRAILTLILGALGLIGAILALTGTRIGGSLLMLIGGIIIIIGLFITVSYYTIGPNTFPIPLTTTFIFVDPFLLLIGGIVGLILKD